MCVCVCSICVTYCITVDSNTEGRRVLGVKANVGGVQYRNPPCVYVIWY